MTPLRRVMNDAIEEWIAHLANIDPAQERAWLDNRHPNERAAFEQKLKQRRADLATAKHYLRKHAPNSPMLSYEID